MIKTTITYNQTHSSGRNVFAGSPNHWTILYPECAILCTHTTYIWGLPRYILVYFKGQVNIYVRGCDVVVGSSRLLIGLWILIPWCNLRGGGMVTHYRQLIYVKKTHSSQWRHMSVNVSQITGSSIFIQKINQVNNKGNLQVPHTYPTETEHRAATVLLRN